MESIKHTVKSQSLMAEEIVHMKAAGRSALNADGEIRRLLYLGEEAARANSVRHTALYEHCVAGLHIELLHGIKHTVNILRIKKMLPAFARHALFKTKVDAGLFPVDLVPAEDMPAFRLAKRAGEKRHGLFPVGMHLKREALSAVDELEQHAQRRAGLLRMSRAEVIGRVAFKQRLERKRRLIRQETHPLVGKILPPDIPRRDDGHYPFLREMPVLAVLLSVQRVKLTASKICAPCARSTVSENHLQAYSLQPP